MSSQKDRKDTVFVFELQKFSAHNTKKRRTQHTCAQHANSGVAAHSKTSAFYNFTGSVDVSELESSIRKFYNYEGTDCRKNVFDEKMLENVQVQQEISSAFNLTTNEIYECINGNSHNLSIFGGKYTIHEFFNYMLPEVSIHPRIDHDNQSVLRYHAATER